MSLQELQGFPPFGEVTYLCAVMELPAHIIDLACCLEERGVHDDSIIRWCLRLYDDPKETMRLIASLDAGREFLVV